MDTKGLPARPDVVAPDGSNVRILLGLGRGALAHFELGAGQTAVAVAHRTVEELWYFLSGRGEMWRSFEGRSEVVEVGKDMCVSIPVGTSFQFRAFDGEPLAAVGATMPPWPGEGEAMLVEGPWEPTVEPGPI